MTNLQNKVNVSLQKQVCGTPLPPTAFAEVLRSSPVISSRQLTWGGILVEQFHNPIGHFDLPPSSSHCLTIHLQHNVTLRREINKHVQQSQMRVGAITFTPAGYASRWYADGEADVLYLHLEPDFVAGLLDTKSRGDEVSDITDGLADYDPQIMHLGLAFKAELEVGSPGGQLYGESLATALAIRVRHRYYRTSQADLEITQRLPFSKMQQVVDYIQDHLADDLTLGELARSVSMSVSHFRAQFKQSLGITPHQFLIQCRIERAKQLLTAGNLPINDVALSVGFADQSHLTRHMRRLLGITPRAFCRTQSRVGSQHHQNVLNSQQNIQDRVEAPRS